MLVLVNRPYTTDEKVLARMYITEERGRLRLQSVFLRYVVVLPTLVHLSSDPGRVRLLWESVGSVGPRGRVRG